MEKSMIKCHYNCFTLKIIRKGFGVDEKAALVHYITISMKPYLFNRLPESHCKEGYNVFARFFP